MNQDEQILRENIQNLIQIVKKKRLLEEEQLRGLIGDLIEFEHRHLMAERGTPDVDPTPNKSTGINVLEELLKKIVPVLETDYKSLTTNIEQRQSFRAHIINAVVNTLTPAILNNQTDDEVEDLDEEIDITVGGDDEKFIDIRTDAEKKAEEEEAKPDEREEFGSGVEGDETGRNMAYQSFKKIETAVIDSYELLSDPEDQELFYDYLIANLKLYFDKFEGELDSTVSEPSNQAYDAAQDASGAAAGSEDEEEIEFEL